VDPIPERKDFGGGAQVGPSSSLQTPNDDDFLLQTPGKIWPPSPKRNDSFTLQTPKKIFPEESEEDKVFEDFLEEEKEQRGEEEGKIFEDFLEEEAGEGVESSAQPVVKAFLNASARGQDFLSSFGFSPEFFESQEVEEDLKREEEANRKEKEKKKKEKAMEGLEIPFFPASGSKRGRDQCDRDDAPNREKMARQEEENPGGADETGQRKETPIRPPMWSFSSDSGQEEGHLMAAPVEREVIIEGQRPFRLPSITTLSPQVAGVQQEIVFEVTDEQGDANMEPKMTEVFLRPGNSPTYLMVGDDMVFMEAVSQEDLTAGLQMAAASPCQPLEQQPTIPATEAGSPELFLPAQLPEPIPCHQLEQPAASHSTGAGISDFLLPALPEAIPCQPDTTSYQPEPMPCQPDTTSYQPEPIPCQPDTTSYQPEPIPCQQLEQQAMPAAGAGTPEVTLPSDWQWSPDSTTNQWVIQEVVGGVSMPMETADDSKVVLKAVAAEGQGQEDQTITLHAEASVAANLPGTPESFQGNATGVQTKPDLLAKAMNVNGLDKVFEEEEKPMMVDACSPQQQQQKGNGRTNLTARRRPGRVRDPLPTGFNRGGNVPLPAKTSKYTRSKFSPEWATLKYGILYHTEEKDNRTYMKKKINKNDVKILTDLIGCSLFPKEEAIPIEHRHRLLSLDGVLHTLPDGQPLMAPQEPVHCPTIHDVYALEFQHGFVRKFLLDEDSDYKSLHAMHWQPKKRVNPNGFEQFEQ